MNRAKPATILDRADEFLNEVLSGEPAYPLFSREFSAVMSGGLLPGKLYTIEGPPDGTKSALAVLMANKLAEDHKIPCVFVSSTLSGKEVYIRSISRISRLHSGDIEGKMWLDPFWVKENGKDAVARVKSRIKDADATFREYASRILMVEVPVEGSIPVSEVSERLQADREYFKEQDGLSELPKPVVFVDTLRGLRYSDERRESGEPTLDELIKMLKELRAEAQRTGCPIVALVDGVAFGRLYLKAGILPSTHGHELGFTSYHADTTILLETDDTLLSEAIQELYDRGQDTDAAKLEDARSRFPLSNPRIAPLVPTYARLTISARGAGAARNIYFIYLKAVGDFLDMSFRRREIKKIYE